MLRMGAETIALDILFTEPASNDEDAALREALAAGHTTVLASDIVTTIDDRFEYESILEPVSTLRTPETLIGHPSMVFFGFTYCPDVCPTGLSRIARALRDLGDDASRVDALFVTLDPTRDTPARLREYTRYFHPAIIGLTGDTDRLDRVARLFNVRYAFVGKDTSEHYSMDHTANVYLVDPRGSVSAILRRLPISRCDQSDAVSISMAKARLEPIS